MKVRQLTRIVLLMYLMAVGTVGSAQNLQIVIAELENTSTKQNICLQDYTHVDNTHVQQDKIFLKRLPANQSGFVEFTINEMATSHITVSLQEESNPANAYTITLNNTEVTYQNTNADSYDHNDVFKIARCGGEINFYKNNILVEPISPIIGGNFNQSLIVVVDVIDANNGADIALEFPHLVPHCVPGSQVPLEKTDFAAVKKELDGSYVRVKDQLLKVWYKERYAIANGQNSAVSYKVYNWKKEIQVSGSLVNCYGINWLQIPLGSTPNDNQYFVLELTGPNKGETYYLRFKNYCSPTDPSAPCNQ